MTHAQFMADQPYLEWMDKQVSHDPEEVFNQCEATVSRMLNAFPELTKVRGNVLISSGYERPHWWLTTPDGTVVDPTAHQFGSKYYGAGTSVVEYVPYDESLGEPTGQCMQCGGLCYRGKVACCEAHERSVMAYYASV